MSWPDFIDQLFQVSDRKEIWITQVFTLVLATVVINFILMRIGDLLAHRVKKTDNLWDDALIQSARVPVKLLVWVLGLTLAIEVLDNVAEAAVFDYLPEVRRVAFVVIAVLFASRLVRFMEEGLVDPARREHPMDKTTASAIGKLLRVSVIITAALIIMQTLGYSISGVVAFGGMGGIAVGFAARDMLANFFGAFMVYLDQPFKVGDWVRSPDREIEGTVEEIGWRLTRIRTFDKRPLYVPNATFSTITVENPSRMLNRRIYEKIGIRYEDWERMHPIVDEVRDMLANHEEIDQNTTLIVNFTSFQDSYLEFFIYTFTKTREWVKFHQIKQEILLTVMEIIDRHGAEIAFPTRTLHMFQEQPGERPPPDAEGESDYADYEPTRPGERGQPKGGDTA